MNNQFVDRRNGRKVKILAPYDDGTVASKSVDTATKLIVEDLTQKPGAVGEIRVMDRGLLQADTPDLITAVLGTSILAVTEVEKSMASLITHLLIRKASLRYMGTDLGEAVRSHCSLVMWLGAIQWRLPQISRDIEGVYAVTAVAPKEVDPFDDDPNGPEGTMPEEWKLQTDARLVFVDASVDLEEVIAAASASYSFDAMPFFVQVQVQR